ncbi:hypothetical protein KBK19_06420 [Microvirga sp. STR05]|uniref:Uncharacterized protein n=1 Tax=Hymenobacter duratus TaxID=2771356 RepID=A0ABR8JGG1_9BACT|nr:hypothetical protein [Hymenobacter duratus]MBD2714663.1 hypothetical protein [Hymenobacter duratus]MBR7949567.1 hypothetical protein [Microvirga sp. STR05]
MADSPTDSSVPTPPPPGPPSEEQVLADPRLRPLLEAYQPLHHDLFLKTYARELRDLHQNGPTYESNLEYLLHQHDKAAYQYMWMIQHQKLFDLECQWRAEQVEVPGAQLTANFEDWHEYIEECPVLPPISPDELDLFDAFLAQLTDSGDLETGNPSRTYWLHRRYPDLYHNSDDDEDEEEMFTPWTEFWDVYRGTGYLRQLPDVRGTKEERYLDAVHDENHRQRPAAPAVEAVPDPRPHVPTWGDDYDDLVRELLRRFEVPALLRQFETKRQLEAYDASDDRTDLPLALERLQNAGPVLVPIEAHADWRQAVIAASHRHYLSQLRAALPRVYEDYCQREALGIRQAPPRETRWRQRERDTHFQRVAELIRKGRRLLHEPDDLNF